MIVLVLTTPPLLWVQDSDDELCQSDQRRVVPPLQRLRDEMCQISNKRSRRTGADLAAPPASILGPPDTSTPTPLPPLPSR
mmetsp:Transcript_3539/g.6160  ORF Transcript_3539/g.6160 Transcript_3539/m.6160 type:complete len:81 (-) Transcript_3539:223-465(-)